MAMAASVATMPATTEMAATVSAPSLDDDDGDNVGTSVGRSVGRAQGAAVGSLVGTVTATTSAEGATCENEGGNADCSAVVSDSGVMELSPEEAWAKAESGAKMATEMLTPPDDCNSRCC